MLKPIGKNLLVKIKPVEQKKGALILTTQSDQPFQATVVDIGSKAEIDVKKGDVLLLVPYCGSRISTEEDGYLLVTERDILGVVNG